jgi:hypothetical protein
VRGRTRIPWPGTRSGGAVVIAFLLCACGTDPSVSTEGSADDTASAVDSGVDASGDEPSTSFDDESSFLLYSTFPLVDTFVVWDSASQLRDYSSTAVIGVLESVQVLTQPGTDPIVEPGVIEASFTVADVLGGRWLPTRSPSSPSDRAIAVKLPMNIEATADQVSEAARVSLGSSYVLFLRAVSLGLHRHSREAP